MVSHPSPAVASLPETREVAAYVGATRSVAVKAHPRHLKTLPGGAFNLNRCDRVCKRVPLPWQVREGQGRAVERTACPLLTGWAGVVELGSAAAAAARLMAT